MKSRASLMVIITIILMITLVSALIYNIAEAGTATGKAPMVFMTTPPTPDYTPPPIKYAPLTKWGLGVPGSGGAIAIAVDSSSGTTYVYVTDLTNNKIRRYTVDANGAPASNTDAGSTWKSTSSTIPCATGPQGLACDSSGNVYVTGNNNTISKYDSSGNLITRWGSSGSSNSQFNFWTWANGHSPVMCADRTSGNVYVYDIYNYRIQGFNSNGGFVTKWISQDGSDFSCIFGMAVDLAGNVYASDCDKRDIQKFNPTNGSLITKWGSSSYFTDSYCNGGVAVDSIGNLNLIAGNLSGTNDYVEEYTSKGSFLTRWAHSYTGHACELAFDYSTGYLYLLHRSANDQYIEVYKPNGHF
jgi:sugar lactone lactonase YvrE